MSGGVCIRDQPPRSLDDIDAAFDDAAYDPPHADLNQPPAPYALVKGDTTVVGLRLTTGTWSSPARCTSTDSSSFAGASARAWFLEHQGRSDGDP